MSIITENPQYNLYNRRSWKSYAFLRKFAEQHGEQAAERYCASVFDQYGQNVSFAMNGSKIGQSFASDTAQSLNFLTDSLTHIDLEAKEQAYAMPNRYTRLFPLKMGIPRGANRVQFTIYDYAGKASVVDNSGNFPVANVIRKADSTPLLTHGVSLQYTLDELEAAQFQGVMLEDKSVKAATLAMRNYKEDTWIKGDSQLDTEWRRGIINQPTTGTNGVETLTALTTAWDASSSAPTPLAIAYNIMDAVTHLIENSGEVIGSTLIGDIIVGLPTKQHSLVHTQPISAENPSVKIADYVKSSNVWSSYYPGGNIVFESIRELKGAGASNADRMVVYLKSEDVLFGGIVIDNERLQVQQTGTMYKIPIRSRISPLYVCTPEGIVYQDGI